MYITSISIIIIIIASTNNRTIGPTITLIFSPLFTNTVIVPVTLNQFIAVMQHPATLLASPMLCVGED